MRDMLLSGCSREWLTAIPHWDFNSHNLTDYQGPTISRRAKTYGRDLCGTSTTPEPCTSQQTAHVSAGCPTTCSQKSTATSTQAAPCRSQPPAPTGPRHPMAPPAPLPTHSDSAPRTTRPHKTTHPRQSTPSEPRRGPHEPPNRFTRTLTPAEPRLRSNPRTRDKPKVKAGLGFLVSPGAQSVSQSALFISEGQFRRTVRKTEQAPQPSPQFRVAGL